MLVAVVVITAVETVMVVVVLVANPFVFNYCNVDGIAVI